jgi:hypothetical protein
MNMSPANCWGRLGGAGMPGSASGLGVARSKRALAGARTGQPRRA